MSDFKKLFKRDRYYWVIIVVVMTLLVIYLLVNGYGMYHKLFHLENYLEWSQYLQGVWETHPELRDTAGFFDEIPNLFLRHMVSATVIAALIAQALRLLTQETQNRAQVLRIFPVKSRNIVTYHYLSGLLTVGIPLMMQIAIVRLNVLYVEKNTEFLFTNKEQLWTYAGKAVIIFMLHYSLLILCRKVTNDVPGTIFTYIVMELAMQLLFGYCLGLYWDNLGENRLGNWVFWAIVTVVLILLSYIANQKQDYARNGVYAFSIVHWVIMGTVFAEIYFTFYSMFEYLAPFGNFHKVLLYLLAIAVSVLMTAGVHFVTKPKKI